MIPLGSSPQIAIEAATEDDLEAILAIEGSSSPHPWPAAHFREEMADPPRRRLVLLRTPPHPDLSRGVLGYGAYRVVADEVHVHNLAVHPRYRQRGLGHILLEAMLRLGAHRGATQALLEVRQSNTAARALYERAGFRVLQRRAGYYTEPVEDALVLGRDAVPSEAGCVSRGGKGPFEADP